MKTPNKSLREKSTSRMMAVQIAYSFHSQQKTPDADAMLLETRQFSGSDGDVEFPPIFKDKPHAPSLNRLLTLYAEHKEVLGPMAQESIKEEWRPERVNALLLIILELAILELDHNRELAVAVIVDEYTQIASRLLDVSDIDFVHASLKKLSEKIRG